jgi:cystathionine beta-lyase/cystathionine gamma-synthase
MAADPHVADPRIAADTWWEQSPAGQPIDPWGLAHRGGPPVARPQGHPPRAIEPRRLAIEAPRLAIEAPRPADQPSSAGAASDRHSGALSHADPLGHTDPLGRTDPRYSEQRPSDQRGALGIADPLRLIDPRRSAVLREADLRAAAGPPPQANRQRSLGENTRSVRLPVPAPPGQQPLAIPIYRTAAFGFGSSAEYAAVLKGAAPGFSYSRIDNPTVEAFCAAVAALEGVNLSYQVAAQAFASGMAAVSTVFWAFARAGAHVVAPAAVYGGSYSFLRNVASSFGVQTDFVDMTDLARVKAALRSGAAIVYAETLANPTVAVTDLAGIARLAHEAGALLVVDSTLAPPVICRPLEHGADLVLHSATKYFGGHSDVTGGVVTGHPELIERIRDIRIDTGGSLGPDDAYLLRRGLETLPLRVRRQCATAQLLAASLVRHPAVRTVYYPGLSQHPGHGLARRQFDAGPEGTRFGAILTLAPHGGQEAGMVFADRLRLAHVATSLGGTHTKVSHVGSTTHRQMDSAAMAAAGIDSGSVRFSVGLEDGEDLLADAMAALDSLGRR